MIAVSTDNLSGAEQSVALFGAQYPILYTAKDSSVPESFGVFNLHGDGLASASVFLVSDANEIVWSSIGTSYTHQVKASEILDQIELYNLSG